MADSENCLYIGCKLLKINNININKNEYDNNEFLEAAKPITRKANLYLQEVTIITTGLVPFVLDFYEYSDKKLPENEKTKRWVNFCETRNDIWLIKHK